MNAHSRSYFAPRSLCRHPERSEAQSKDPVDLQESAEHSEQPPPATGDFWIYILSNERRTVLYVGITNSLESRIAQHLDGRGSDFTRAYKLTCLLYYENFPDPVQAIAREKQLKRRTRAKKVALIGKMNPEFHDLVPVLYGRVGAVAQGRLTDVARGPSTALRSAQDDRDSGGSRLACHPERIPAGAQSSRAERDGLPEAARRGEPEGASNDPEDLQESAERSEQAFRSRTTPDRNRERC
jgi:putative endonuclease